MHQCPPWHMYDKYTKLHTTNQAKHRLHFLSFFSSSFATGALAAASDRKPPTGVPWRFTLRRR